MKPTKKARILLAMVASLSLMASLVATPAVAQPAVGEIVFEGEARLDVFPCPPEDPLTCEADFDGTVIGAYLAGDDDGTSWSVTGSGGSITANFDYGEDGCETGAAEGSGSVDIVHDPLNGDVVVGNYGTTPINDVHVTFDFRWDRTGNTAVIILAEIEVRLTNNGANVATVTFDVGVAVAGFVPIPDNAKKFVKACELDGPPTGVTAQVAGSATIGDTP